MTRLDAFPLGDGTGRLGRPLHELLDVDGLERELQAIRVGTADRQDVVHQMAQPPRVAVDHLEEPRLVLGEIACLALAQQFEVPDDRRQRCTELVRDHRDEGLLQLVELEQALVLLPEGLRSACARVRSADCRASVTDSPFAEYPS